MITKIYTVYDTKSEAYLQPFFMQANGAAIRAFSDMANDTKHQFGAHPEDYTLFHLGAYDDNTGAFDILPTPVALGKAIEFVKQQPQLPLLKTVEG